MFQHKPKVESLYSYLLDTSLMAIHDVSPELH